MEDAGIFYVHLVHCTAIFAYFVAIWYILVLFGIFYRFWYVVTRKSGNPGLRRIVENRSLIYSVTKTSTLVSVAACTWKYNSMNALQRLAPFCSNRF
jgi:hypothetical protein